MKVDCCHCGKSINISAKVAAIPEQVLKMKISYTGDLLAAKTIWEVVKNFEEMMKGVGEELKQNTSTSVRKIEMDKGELLIEFLITNQNQ